MKRTAINPDEAEDGNAKRSPSRSLEESIGAHLKSLRARQNLSLAELAIAAGVSKGMLSKIENGQISPSLTTLQAIAGVLQVPLSSLFVPFEQRLDCSFVPAGEGLMIDRRGTKLGHVYKLLGHVLRGDTSVEPFLIELSKDAETYTQFRHSGVELIYVLEGKVLYQHGAATYDMGPGDTLLFDSRASHGPAEIRSEMVRFLSIIISGSSSD